MAGEYDRKRLLDELGGILSAKRMEHTLGVEHVAVELARRYGADVEKASVAALLHDCAKPITKGEGAAIAKDAGIDLSDYMRMGAELMHAPLGAYIAEKRFGVTDAEILSAIRWHTTGKRDMSLLDKIIYVADLIEPSRSFPDADIIREAANDDIDMALLMSIENCIRFVMEKRKLLHPDSVDAYNDIIKHINKKSRK